MDVGIETEESCHIITPTLTALKDGTERLILVFVHSVSGREILTHDLPLLDWS